ncbi:XRE family transcriptional regulator [Actinomycetospora succinea]|uniref:XRE family transcriptional regulator n=2 Tax=Actinomycetospora succinea TaxID=663603 RepID=A0A4V3D894_9PSEU|nr:XRE family transcriptional regulator [Actinomycetospora succinea]
MAAMSGANAVVGRNVGMLRSERRMSASELARKAGISKATVLSIEIGKANPTVETLQSLADALGVTITDLVSDGARRVVADVRRRAEASWHPLGTLRIRPLATIYGPNLVYVFVAVLSEEGYSDDGHEASSVESLYVLSGTVSAGPVDDPKTLGPGDFIRFTADGPHMYRALDGTAEALLVIGRNQVPDVGIPGEEE